MRIGIGYDIHPLGEGRKLILGGVEIPHPEGLVGHSDADALVHSVCDALLGALGEGDLGKHYPSSDARYKDISSLLLLEQIAGKLTQRGYRLINVDTVIIAQAPRLGPFLDAMRDRMAEVLKMERQAINVKVKSGEGLDDPIGREEAIAAQAVCLIEAVQKS
jgi:2-C-methyl-D-erythritol 2,4-cyclodiphosphate synthase